MKKHELKEMGIPNAALEAAADYCYKAACAGLFKRYKPKELIQKILDNPQEYFKDSVSSRFAKAVAAADLLPKINNAPYKVWGEDKIELSAINQLRESCRLPISVRASLMPDAHYGYGLPVGGVLATLGSVIPYAVGVDIACRMKLSIIDIEPRQLQDKSDRFIKALNQETKFGAGQVWESRKQHKVMDSSDWKVFPLLRDLKDKAWSQLGTSGGGNHFVEFGITQFSQPMPGIEVGKEYIAVLSHSGSRGPGAQICKHYSNLASKSLPKDFAWAKNLAWLDLESEAGKEYWLAMNLMGDYAAGNHDVIHRSICQNLGTTPIAQIENHHNFAWKEIHDGAEVIVHRKGATPAGEGVLGVIPGSMADPAFIVKGKGNIDSLTSASHGAGRRYSRSHAKASFNWEHWEQELKRRGVNLLSAGLDEVPGAYKDIEEVMARQEDLVETIARFDPKIVKMADDGTSED